MRHAIELVNNKHDGWMDDLLPTTQVLVTEEQVSCGEGDGIQAPEEAVENLKREIPDVTMVIGPSCSGDLRSVASNASRTLSGLTVPFVSWSSTVDALNDEVIYPNVLRLATSDAHYVKALVQLMVKNGWSRVSVCHEDTFWGRSTGKAFIDELDSQLGAVANVLNRGAAEYSAEEMTTNPLQSLTRLEATGAKIIFFVAGSKVQRSMFSAIQQEMILLGRGYAWLLPYQTSSAFTENDGSLNPSAIKGAAGAISARSASTAAANEDYIAIVSTYTMHWGRRSSIGGCSRNDHVRSSQDASSNFINDVLDNNFAAAAAQMCGSNAGANHFQQQQQQPGAQPSLMYCDADGRAETFVGYSTNAIDAVSVSLRALHYFDNRLHQGVESGGLSRALYDEMKQTENFQGMSGVIYFDEFGDKKGNIAISNLQINTGGCGVDFVHVGNYASNEGVLTLYDEEQPIIYPGGVEAVPRDRNPEHVAEKLTRGQVAAVVVGGFIFAAFVGCVVRNDIAKKSKIKMLQTKLDKPIDFALYLKDMIKQGLTKGLRFDEIGVNGHLGIPREIDRSNLTMVGQLGSGSFGEIWEGNLNENKASNIPEYPVVCKMCQDENQTNELIVEAAMMAQIPPHTHTLTLIGVCTKGSPYLLIMPICELGSLDHFLREQACARRKLIRLDLFDRLRLGLDVAKGMEHLASHFLVHRDLAARNVLIDHRFICKVADFSLTRNVKNTGGIFRCPDTDTTFPVRWTAPEAIEDYEFSTMTDVWSFGVVMDEIMTDGALPYKTMSNLKVAAHVIGGNFDRKPKKCPDNLWETVFIACWKYDPRSRPSFAKLVDSLDSLAGAAHKSKRCKLRIADHALYLRASSRHCTYCNDEAAADDEVGGAKNDGGGTQVLTQDHDGTEQRHRRYLQFTEADLAAQRRRTLESATDEVHVIKDDSDGDGNGTGDERESEDDDDNDGSGNEGRHHLGELPPTPAPRSAINHYADFGMLEAGPNIADIQIFHRKEQPPPPPQQQQEQQQQEQQEQEHQPGAVQVVVVQQYQNQTFL